MGRPTYHVPETGMGGNDQYRKRKRMFRLLLQHGVSPKLRDAKGEDVLRHARRFATPPLRRHVEFALRPKRWAASELL